MRKKTAKKVEGEGWQVFYCVGGDYDGLYCIQRVDDPDIDFGTDDVQLVPAFRNDAEAITHVIKCAKRGEKNAVAALWSAAEDCLVHEILWKMHFKAELEEKSNG